MDVAASAKLGRPGVLSVPLLEPLARCVLPHAVTSMCTVTLSCGCAVLAAGGAVVSAGLASSLLRPRPSENGGNVSLLSAPLETLSVSSGLITCLAATPLPGSAAALCAAGTSGGAVSLFLIADRGGGRPPGLIKLCETSLMEFAEGRIGATDAIVDVCIGLDPAGRPEFIAAASSSAVVLVDTQHFDDALRAIATEAVLSAVVERPRSDALCVSFSDAEIVRVLAPTRFRAAFALDVALVIVLDSGALRYLARSVAGGSVQLLLEHHQQRQARQGPAGLTRLEAADNSVQSINKTNNNNGNNNGGCSTPRALSHVRYGYSLSPIVHELGGRDPQLTVNDATLRYDAAARAMRLILAGAETQSVDRTGNISGVVAGWWAVADAVVRPRGTLTTPINEPIHVVAFAGAKTGTLPRDRRGISMLLTASDDAVLFTCGNEVYASGIAEAVAAGRTPLRYVYSSGSPVSGIARVGEWDEDGASAVLLACGASLALLAL